MLSKRTSFSSFVGLIALCSLSATGMAGTITISQIADQTLNLGATTTVPVTITVAGDGAGTSFAVDSSSLTQDPAHDVSFQFTQTRLLGSDGSRATLASNLVVTTKTSAPSFAGGTFRVNVTSGSDSSFQDVHLTVNALFVVNVMNGTNGDQFAFDSAPDLAYFRAHTEGLVLTFRNLSDGTLVIHGEGAIPHQDTDNPLTPAVVDSTGAHTPSANGIYTIPAIMPADGADLPGYYTVHNIYKPERRAVFNATTIPSQP